VLKGKFKMKKLVTLMFMFALAIGAVAQNGTRPNATGHTRPNAIPGPSANSTVNVPPVAKVPPVAHRGGRK
jgi:hypothetical protein